ncbi:DUF3024 domain-containing protein [Paenibacillus thermotolerans]|uniref:DUF3024 domain-containing protein n=1 Tax=Paenibacillus thermotolerans TaxID=3027807 RepID=UPI00236749F7|nr:MULTISPECIES: DUF3024 domain-containing protein [unclassified Paenibacillus]
MRERYVKSLLAIFKGVREVLDVFTKKRIEKILENYIDKKIPEHLRNDIQIHYKFRGNTVTLSQERPGYMGRRFEYPIAQLRLEESYWKVYWQDSKNKWHFVDDIKPEKDFEKQLKEIDGNSIFWV